MKSFLAILLILMSTSVFSQVGDRFPDMEAESLTNKMVNIPGDLEKYTLVVLAYSKKSEQDLRSWYSPIYNQFIYKPEKQSLFSGNYDIDVFFVPMFTGAKRPAYQKVMKKVKAKMDPKMQPHVMFYKGTMKEYKKALKFDEGKDVPYFYVLDPDGKIINTTTGKYTDRKMQDIVDAVAPSFGN